MIRRVGGHHLTAHTRVLAGALEARQRGFVQGGPPPGEMGTKSKAQEFLKSKANEMDERLEKRKKEHLERYTSESKPMPLFENAFVPGKFGMRRRLVVQRFKDKAGGYWDAKERGNAVADAQTSFFK